MPNRPSSSAVVSRSIVAVLAISLLGLLAGVWLIVSAQATRDRLQRASIATERYLSALKDVETGYRGFVIVGSEAYLQPYADAKAGFQRNAQAVADSLSRAGIDPSDAQRMLASGEAVMQYAQQIVETRRSSWQDARDLIASGQGKGLMDAARNASGAAQAAIAAGERYLAGRQSSRYVPLLLASFVGLLVASAAFALNATRSRRAEALAQTLLADVFGRAPVGLALVDQQRRVVQSNPSFAAMVAGDKRPLSGLPLAQVSPEVGPYLHERVADALAGRVRSADADAEASSDELTDFETAAGAKCLKVDVFPALLTSPDGVEYRGAGIVVNDLTRQREWETELSDAKEAAESANRAKSAFIANMSHELRTPLTAVLGYCDLIEEDVRDLGHEAILADLQKINVNARHLLGLLNDVLDLSKIEAQKMDVHPVEFEVATLLSEVESACASLVEKNANQLKTVADDPHARLFSDDLKLRQILLNLIGNAAKFTNDGTIEIRVAQVDLGGMPHTRFEVADTGIGMSRQQLAGLFERFSQADSTTTRKYGGTGLGLALTRALSLMLGGNVAVESEPGRGTTFTVTVPTRWVAPSVETATPEAAEGSAPAADATGQTVLVIDDEASARELLRRHLTKEGFAVSLATSGAQALEMLATLRPTAVLLDVMLPGMDGWHVLKAIRNNPETAHIPVIMQTVLGDERFAYAMGASGFLRKPVRRSALTQAIRDAVAAESAHDVLIVDDDQAATKRLTELLERDGWTVASAANGAQALASMRNRTPALVLVDLVMPAMDGYAFIREVRNNPQWDSVALVVMTSADIESTRVRKLEEDTDAIVQKGSMPLAQLAADLRRFAQPRAAAQPSPAPAADAKV